MDTQQPIYESKAPQELSMDPSQWANHLNYQPTSTILPLRPIKSTQCPTKLRFSLCYMQLIINYFVFKPWKMSYKELCGKQKLIN